MTKPPYTLRGVRLDALIQTLLTTSKSAFEARAKLTDLLESDDVEISRSDDVEISPVLPSLWRVRLLEGGGLAVEGSAGILDATQFFVRQRPMFQLSIRERVALERARCLACTASHAGRP